MNIMYKCCFCAKPYDWYEGVRKDPENEAGAFIKANSFVLTRVDPIDINIGGATVQSDDDVLDTYINLCPNCMRKLLDNIRIDGSKVWDL